MAARVTKVRVNGKVLPLHLRRGTARTAFVHHYDVVIVKVDTSNAGRLVLLGLDIIVGKLTVAKIRQSHHVRADLHQHRIGGRMVVKMDARRVTCMRIM